MFIIDVKNFGILFVLFSILLLTGIISNFNNSAFGHGFQYHCSYRDFRIEDVTFQKTNVEINEVITITGKIVNFLDKEQETSVGILLYEDSFLQRVNHETNKLLKNESSPCVGHTYNGNPELYFDVKPSFTQKIILPPNNETDYKIEITPLKSGTYHVHSALYINDLYRPHMGQTIIVEGNSSLTEMELSKFYVPFFSSLALIIFGVVLGVFLLKRRIMNSSS